MSAKEGDVRGAGSALSYMPQLDGLRTLAVLGVFAVHFLPGDNVVRVIQDWGLYGVRLFFVLSGFLITGILVSCRARLEREGGSRGRMIANFYARRFLRLFPLYYLYLLAAFTIWPATREYMPWYLVYGQNFLFAIDENSFTMMTHFWTLAIEEQFYLTWPWVILLTPRRYLLPTVVGVVICGPLFRMGGIAAGLTPLQIGMMMPAHFDTLAMGGLLALLADPNYGYRPHAEKMLRVGLRVGLPLIVLYGVLDHFMVLTVPRLLIGELSTGLFFSWVVGRAAVGFGGPMGSFLSAAPVVYCGTVSYGLYVIHYHVPGLLREKILPHLGLSLPEGDSLQFILFSAVSLLLAAMSWHFYEKPLNSLKRHFPYHTKTRPEELTVADVADGGEEVASSPRVSG